MILDNIKFSDKYNAMHKNFEKGFEFIKKYLENPLENGTYEIDGEDVYASVMDADLSDEGRFETHDKYIDIQFVVTGTERMEYTNYTNVEIIKDLRPEKDVKFHSNSPLSSSVNVNENEFVIFFPHDAHKPCLKSNVDKVKKIVVKVKCC